MREKEYRSRLLERAATVGACILSIGVFSILCVTLRIDPSLSGGVLYTVLGIVILVAAVLIGGLSHER